MKPTIILLVLFLSCQTVFSQDSLLVLRDTFPSKIITEYLDSSIRFKPIIRPLSPIPGGRQAYYTYLWDFGDGNFSTKESPEHRYAKEGEYDVSLFIVNNYDNGPRPRKPKTKVVVEAKYASNNKHSNNFYKQFFKSNPVFQLFKNANAVPGEDMSIVVGVNPLASKGRIIILTNERTINPKGFIVSNQSKYHNEILVPLSTTHELNTLWSNIQATTVTRSGSPDYGIIEEIEFKNNEANKYFNQLISEYNTVSQYDISGVPGEGQFSIINLDVTPDMLADTNAIVTVTGIYIPDGQNPTIHKLDIPIVQSHDPNKMSVRPALIDYRLQFKKKEMIYKVQFQNDGEGDAKTIRLEMNFPDQINTKTFKLLNLYPECDTCNTQNKLGCYTVETLENKITFTFNGIALPGSSSPTITDQDSTKGFIRFTLQTHKKLQNKSIPSYTDIYFDKNEPIRTNRSTMRFRPGLSPIVFLGINSPFGSNGDETDKITSGISFGVGVAPIAPYKKPYWQAELYFSSIGQSFHTSFPSRSGEIQIGEDNGRPRFAKYTGIDSISQKKHIVLQIPLQMRYNFNRYFSAGIGASLKTNYQYYHRESSTYHIASAGPNTDPFIIETINERKVFSPLQLSSLIDINVGRVYLGPAFGIRHQFDKKFKNNLNFYLMWRL